MVKTEKTQSKCTQKTSNEAWPSITKGRIAKVLKSDRNRIAKTVTAVKSTIRPAPNFHLSKSQPNVSKPTTPPNWA